jgi:alanine racemase
MKAYVVERDALVQNIQAIRRFAGTVPIWGVLKGNGYGIGIVPFSRILRENGIDRFAVTELKEAEVLRESWPEVPILMLRSTADAAEINALLDLGVILTVGCYETAVAINGIAAERAATAEVHLAVDTGMGRYGFLPDDVDKILSVFEYMKNLRVSGIFTHFHSAFSNEKATKLQFEKFTAVVEKLKTAGYDPGMVHCCNSHAFVRHPEMHLGGVRIGSAFLGRLSFKDKLGLQRVGHAECTLEEIRWIPKGQTVGYDAGFKARQPMRVAVIGIGWYNGFASPRQNDLFRIRDSIGGILHHLKNLLFPGKILVTVNGHKCRILGHVGMVHAVVDVTDVDCTVGDKVIAAMNPLSVKGLRVQYR